MHGGIIWWTAFLLKLVVLVLVHCNAIAGQRSDTKVQSKQHHRVVGPVQRLYRACHVFPLVFCLFHVCYFAFAHLLTSLLQLAAFKVWCASRNIILGEGVELFCLDDDNCGVRVWRDLAANTVVARIPLVAMLNVEHALTEPKSQHVWDSDFFNEESELDLMAAFLVYEKSKPTPSAWQAFLDFLPSEFPDFDLAMLQGSPVQSKFLHRKNHILEVSARPQRRPKTYPHRRFLSCRPIRGLSSI